MHPMMPPRPGMFPPHLGPPGPLHHHHHGRHPHHGMPIPPPFAAFSKVRNLVEVHIELYVHIIMIVYG